MARTSPIDTGTRSHSSIVDNNPNNPGDVDSNMVDDFDKLMDEEKEQLSDHDNPQIPDDIGEALLLKYRDGLPLTPDETAKLQKWLAEKHPSLTLKEVVAKLPDGQQQISPVDNILGGVATQKIAQPPIQTPIPPPIKEHNQKILMEKLASMIGEVRAASDNNAAQTAEIQLRPQHLGGAEVTVWKDATSIYVNLKITPEQLKALPPDSLEGLLETLQERFGNYAEITIETDDSGQRHGGDGQQQGREGRDSDDHDHFEEELD